MNYQPGSTLTANGETYELKQFHFHLPSEHTVDGDHRAMEMHLVHAKSTGELAVLGVFIEAGEDNAVLAPVWNEFPHRPKPAEGEKEVPPEHVTIEGTINAADLLPTERIMYRYPGSLTTPPCSEGVYWLVLKDPIQLGTDQIKKFKKIFKFNNRPVQSLYDRKLCCGDVLHS